MFLEKLDVGFVLIDLEVCYSFRLHLRFLWPFHFHPYLHLHHVRHLLLLPFQAWIQLMMLLIRDWRWENSFDYPILINWNLQDKVLLCFFFQANLPVIVSSSTILLVVLLLIIIFFYSDVGVSSSSLLSLSLSFFSSSSLVCARSLSLSFSLSRALYFLTFYSCVYSFFSCRRMIILARFLIGSCNVVDDCIAHWLRYFCHHQPASAQLYMRVRLLMVKLCFRFLSLSLLDVSVPLFREKCQLKSNRKSARGGRRERESETWC